MHDSDDDVNRTWFGCDPGLLEPFGSAARVIDGVQVHLGEDAIVEPPPKPPLQPA